MKFKEFDFRVWNNDSCEYMDSIGLYIFRNFEDDSRFAGIGEAYFNEERIAEINEFDEDLFEIELWTSFYDSSNKRIYENDILQDEYNKCYIVKFDEEIGGFVGSLVGSKDNGLNNYTILQLVDKGCNVIGNIH